jgi:hypothetical protein
MMAACSTWLRTGALLIALACEGGNARGEVAAAKAKPPVVVLDGASAQAHAGKVVAVKGMARDARISAAVVADGLTVYCIGLERWPGDVSGKPVFAHGRLEQTNEFATVRGPGGEVSAGTDRPVWVLRDCRYKAAN